MGGRPNALRKVRRSRRLAGLGPSSVRPVRRPCASSKTRRRCGRCSPCAATASSSPADTETAGPEVENAPAVTSTTRTECPSLRPGGGDVGRCRVAAATPSTSRRVVAGRASPVPERNSSAAEKTRSPGQSSSRTRPVRSSRRVLSAALGEPSLSRSCPASYRVARAEQNSLQGESSSSLTPDVSNSESTESAEGIEAVAGDAGSSQLSTGAEQRGAREPVELRRPAHEFIRTFPDHLGGVPTQGESFCCCPKKAQTKDLQCSCGEEDSNFEWTWDYDCKSSAAEVSESRRETRFHINYSSGTAAVRGSEPMTDGQYFWEIKMITPVYGTDMMVGVGTANVDLDAFQYNFCSLLGRDGESWGLSYYGKAQHKGQFTNICSARFGQGSIIGLHLDMWQGTLSYYKNRQPLGVIFSGLRGKTLYPMVSSTAARTGMKLIKACSYATSLEFLCCQVLRKMVPLHLDVTTALSMPPGLHEFFLVNNLFWLLRSNRFSIPNMEAGKKRQYPFSEESAESCSEAECNTKRTKVQ